MKIGKLIKRARRDDKMTQQMFADRFGYKNRETIARWEKESNWLPRVVLDYLFEEKRPLLMQMLLEDCLKREDSDTEIEKS